MLKIYNTLTGRKEEFKPLTQGQVKMYVCGVTVYDECHLGHARSALVFEMIRRYLAHSGLAVTFVKNFTDVDDKIINRANELKIPWQAVTARYIDAYYRDMGRLGIQPATVEPKATEHMTEIIELVKTLLSKGVAYQVNGDVYFQVEKYGAYGRLSKRKLDDMQAGARVEVDERKRHPMDFALWKGAKPGEPSWDSPWGKGRPGWHIECSAMSMKHLGETFDIHGGGMDLIFPHHENEIAQSCAATGKEFARYWLHNGFVQINQEKMSKSLGNFFTIREIFEKWKYPEQVTAEVLRGFLLATHYRSPVDFSDQALEESKKSMDGFYGLFQRLEEPSSKKKAGDQPLRAEIERLKKEFSLAMDDDFNTSSALAAFQRLRGETNKLFESGISQEMRAEVLQAFQNYGRVLGLFQIRPEQWKFQTVIVGSGALAAAVATVKGAGEVVLLTISGVEIERMIAERSEAKKRRDFARADEIRQALAAQGITLEDRPDGTTRWKR
jgi:cysteinyl-tRNA synthetase